MKNVLLTIVLIQYFIAFSYGQYINTIEGSVGIGHTFVNAENYAELSLSGEDHTSFQLTGQLYFSNYKGFEIGSEIGYQNLFEYSFKECSGCYTAYRGVDAFKVLAVARKELSESWNYELYLGGYFYQGYFAVGTGASILYKISLGDKWYIPVKFRGDVIIDTDAPMIPVGLLIGLGYKF